MSEIDYELPGMAGWGFKSTGYSNYLYSPVNGLGFQGTVPIASPVIAAEIGANVKRIVLSDPLATFEQAESAAQAAMNIDWQAMLDPSHIFIAPLLNAVPVTAAQKADNTDLVDQICELVRKLAA